MVSLVTALLLAGALCAEAAPASGDEESTTWTACPITEPYGACAPPTHADVATVGIRKVIDPADGMQLVAFRLKNGSASVKRDVRLCVQYGMP